MGPTDAHKAERTRRAILAGLGNVFAAPAGYFYAGAWRAGWAATVALITVGLVALQVSVMWPPGVYAMNPWLIGALYLASIALLGAHASWLGWTRPAARSRAARLVAYTAALLVLSVSAFAVRAYWPTSVYSVATPAMEPDLHMGDLVAVNGRRAFCNGYAASPGDVVIYADPMEHRRYIRRVVAISADQPGSVQLSDVGLASNEDLCGPVVRVINSRDRSRIGAKP